jgi:hypothetical protein
LHIIGKPLSAIADAWRWCKLLLEDPLLHVFKRALLLCALMNASRQHVLLLPELLLCIERYVWRWHMQRLLCITGKAPGRHLLLLLHMSGWRRHVRRRGWRRHVRSRGWRQHICRSV